MDKFWFCFVPLFVAVDAIGVLPLFMSLTAGVGVTRLRSIILQSLVTATAVAVVFILAGTSLLRLMGITVGDFTVAGGTLLFVLSMNDMLRSGKPQRHVDPATVGTVPIGVPLITGPAVLTTCLLLVGHSGTGVTVIAALVNILIAGIVFWFAIPISRFLGSAGTRTLSKIASLLLASIAVMMVRKGVMAIIQGAG